MPQLIFALAALAFITARAEGTPANRSSTPDAAVPPSLAASVFIDTKFENASPLWYDFLPDGTVLLHPLYDHERFSPNRAAGHLHFRVHAPPGLRLSLELTNLSNVWNGSPGSVANELKNVVISRNGRDWTPLATQSLAGDRIRILIEMPGPELYVARVEPYRISDLELWLARIRQQPLVGIEGIGKTVQGRALEIVRIGHPRAPHRIFLRARAHPWESGGNWVIEGLADRLLRDDLEARSYLERYCVYILPMANKDGVAYGMTRFNLRGKDLNRDWEKPADPALSPENAALETWLTGMIQREERPELALELHNDGSGLLHVSRPPGPNLNSHLERMARFERLLRQYTWFTEGSTQPSFRNSGTLGDGWLERYGIDAAVHEFNCNWIAGLNEPPSARSWKEYGADLARVFYQYFAPGRL